MISLSPEQLNPVLRCVLRTSAKTHWPLRKQIFVVVIPS